MFYYKFLNLANLSPVIQRMCYSELGTVFRNKSEMLASSGLNGFSSFFLSQFFWCKRRKRKGKNKQKEIAMDVVVYFKVQELFMITPLAKVPKEYPNIQGAAFV